MKKLSIVCMILCLFMSLPSVESRKRRIIKLMRIVEDLQQQIDALRDGSCQCDNSHLEAEVSRLTTENNALRNRVTNLEDFRDFISVEVNNLLNRLIAVENRVGMLEQCKDDLEVKVTDLEEWKIDIEDRVEDLEDCKDEMKDDIDELWEKLNEIDRVVVVRILPFIVVLEPKIVLFDKLVLDWDFWFPIFITWNVTINKIDFDPVAFMAQMNGSSVPGEVISFPEVLLNVGNDYRRDTSMFVCPISGIYSFSFSINSGELSYDLMSSATLIYEKDEIEKEIATVKSSNAGPNDLEVQGASSALLFCAKGGKVYVTAGGIGSDFSIDNTFPESVFSGFLYKPYLPPRGLII